MMTRFARIDKIWVLDGDCEHGFCVGHAVSARRLGFVQGFVSTGQKAVQSFASNKSGNAKATRDVRGARRGQNRQRLQTGAYRLNPALNLSLGHGVSWQENRKFLTAQARHDGRRRGHCLQNVRCMLQRYIASGVPQSVIDLLKVIQIQHHQLMRGVGL